jgi:hypothetical protein
MSLHVIQKVCVRKNLAAASLLFLLASGFVGCGGNSLPGGAAPTAKTLKSLVISPATAVVALGGSKQFVVTGVFSDFSQQDMTNKVTWNSTQSAVAAVSSTGMALSKQAGTTSVTAVSGAITGSAVLTVSSAALVSIAVTPANATVPKGETQQFVATGTYSDGTTQDLTASAVWTSSASSIATASSVGAAAAQATGTATITATSGSISGTASLTVSPAVLLSIAVTPSNPTVPKGNTQQLAATGTFSDGSTQNLTGSVVWAVAPGGIAAVSGTGMATAQSIGSATVTAGSGSIVGADVVTVSAPVLTSIAVAPANSSIGLGGTEQMSATGTLSDGTTQDLTSSATWASASPTVASISATGLAEGDGLGMAVISATSGAISGSGTVVVMPLAADDYFTNANTAGAPDATFNVSNPGLTGGPLCAMIYVFDDSQEMNECCGCPISADGMRVFSVNTDLTANTLTTVTLKVGVVRIVSADAASNPGCNAGSVTPAGMLASWSTHIQSAGPGLFATTEVPSRLPPLSNSELSLLQDDCTFIQNLGSGHGICSCGSGD